ncbi:MAG: radical SAM protein [Planctomycetota bacterium]
MSVLTTRPIRVLLLKPFQATGVITCMPPLGLLYIASTLRQHFGSQVEVRFQDLYITRTRYNQIDTLIRDFRPDVVGLSALNWEAEECGRVAHEIRSKHPKIMIAVGGPFAHRNTKRICATGVYDWVFDGESDWAFPIAVERWFGGDRVLDDVVGLTFRDGNGYQNNNLNVHPGKRFVGVVDDLDKVPFPAWDLVDFDAYTKNMNMNGMLRGSRYAPLFTSRGCPFLCTYCHDIFGKKFRARSPENVIAEVELLKDRYKVDELEIVDDIFNMNSPRMKTICRGLEPLKMHLCFPNGLRFDILDEEDVDALVDAGTYSACVAVETVTPRLQQLIKKRLHIEQTKRAINQMARRGVLIRGFFMLGFPTETLEEIQATIDFACTAELAQAYFFHVIPQPGTPLYDLAKGVDKAAIQTQILQEYNGSNTWYGSAYGVDMAKVQRNAYIRFYFGSPKRLWTLFRGIRMHDLVRDFYHFIRILLRVAKRVEEPLPEALQPLAQLYAPDEDVVTSATVYHQTSSAMTLPVLENGTKNGLAVANSNSELSLPVLNG